MVVVDIFGTLFRGPTPPGEETVNNDRGPLGADACNAVGSKQLMDGGPWMGQRRRQRSFSGCIFWYTGNDDMEVSY
jgi:hypothetical protein